MTYTIIDLGKIKFKWKGDYNALTAYKADDVVSYQQSSWVCIADSTGNVPSSSSSYWDLMAEGANLSTTLTTQGDLLTRDGSGLARVGIGNNGQYLGVNSAGTDVEWQAVDTGAFVLKRIFVYEYTGGVWSATTTYNWGEGAYVDFTPQHATSSSDKIVAHYNISKGAVGTGYGMLHGRYYEASTILSKRSWQAQNYHDTSLAFTWVHNGYSGQRRLGWQFREYSSSHQAKIHSTYHYDGTSTNIFMQPQLAFYEYKAV